MFYKSFKIILFIIATLVFGTLSPVVTNSSAATNLDQISDPDDLVFLFTQTSRQPSSIGLEVTNTRLPSLTSVREVESGGSHTCALMVDESVKCWGNGEQGQLGNGSLSYRNTAFLVSDISTAKQISLGSNHTCALLEDKTIKCWGLGSTGRLGNGGESNQSTPVTVSGITNATQISLGNGHACALLEDKTIKCWGYGSGYQLGHGSTSNESTPVTVSGITNATQISLGSNHTCALLEDKTIKCWGRGIHGQLGNGSTSSKSTPVAVSGITNATQISLGNDHTCALLEDKTIKCWGLGSTGRLGNGGVSNQSTPVTVSGITNATQISLGNGHTCALLEDKTIKCWGLGSTGRLGNGGVSNQSTPVAVSGITNAMHVSTGEGSCALLEGETIKCWGARSSFNWQLGNDSNSSSLYATTILGELVSNVRYRVEWSKDGSDWQGLESDSASIVIPDLSASSTYNVRISSYFSDKWSDPSVTQQMETSHPPLSPLILVTSNGSNSIEIQAAGSTVLGITSATQISLGSTHTCALLENKTIMCWGYGYGGQLGNGSNRNQEYPVSVIGIANATQVAADKSGDLTCALLEDKTIKCWGLGVLTPYALNGASGVKQISIGGNIVCALLEDKSIQCWDGGLNFSPIAKTVFNSAVQVTNGTQYTCALMEDKTVKCWGNGSGGQLGTGGFESSETPENVIGISGAIQISAGRQHTCALMEDKTVKCWGNGSEGQLGNGSRQVWNSPVQVLGISSAVEISAGGGHTCARLESESVKCWGNGQQGQLGNGALQHSALPTWASNGSTIQISTGGLHTCEVSQNRSIQCWGMGTTGQLGNGKTSLLEPDGKGLRIEKYRFEWSTDGSNWQSLETQEARASITGLSGATLYQVRVKAYSLAGYSEPSQATTVATTGTRSMRFTFKLSDGRPLTGGAVSWALNDGSYASATNYGVPSTGVLNFPRVAAGTGTITVNGLQSPTGESISFTRTVELGHTIHNVTVPAATGKGSYKINVKLPNGEPVLGASVSVTGLNSIKTVEEIAYNLPRASSGSTNDQGWFQASGFVSGTPRAKVTYSDGVLVQTKFVNLTSATTNVVLDEMPWIEVNEASKTVSSGSLISIPVSVKGAKTKSGYKVTISAPSGSTQKCKGRVLSAKTNSSGKATLKVCATKSGSYKVKSKGAVSTGVVTLKVKKAPPLPVTALTARSTSLGSATVTWGVPSYTGGASITGYKVIITGGGKTFTKTTKLRTHTFTGLKNATQYKVTVEAITKHGSSSRVTVKVGVA
jgi:alpha-tubulin suppressor-like RCC1 family protein